MIDVLPGPNALIRCIKSWSARIAIRELRIRNRLVIPMPCGPGLQSQIAGLDSPCEKRKVRTPDLRIICRED